MACHLKRPATLAAALKKHISARKNEMLGFSIKYLLVISY